MKIDLAVPEEFATVVDAHWSEIVTHCYRMMGSLRDAEGVAQDVLSHSHDSPDFFPGRTPVHFRIAMRTRLFRVATHACLSDLRARPRRVLPASFGVSAGSRAPVPDLSRFVGPFPDALYDRPAIETGGRYTFAESITLGFIAALQQLSPYQRSVFILREVLGWTAHEVAQQLEHPVTSVNSTLHMARADIRSALRVQDRVDPTSESARRELLGRYVKAWVDGDAGALAGLLREDATFSMPPGDCFRGPSEVAGFLRGRVFSRAGRRLASTRSNGRDAFGAYLRSGAATRHFEPQSIQVIEFWGNAVGAIVCFPDPSLISRFGLPERLCRSWTQPNMLPQI